MLKKTTLKPALIAIACSIALPICAQNALPIEVPAGDIVAALNSLAKQANIELVFQAEKLKGIRTAGVNGTYAPQEAVGMLLKGTGLTIHVDPSGAMFISMPTANGPAKSDVSSQAGAGAASTLRLAHAESETGAPQANEAALDDSSGADREAQKGIPEVLVTGSRILNMDVVRTRDDPQPYQILDSEMIERSGAVSVEDFLKRSLTTNTTALSKGQLNVSAPGNSSEINLRNLGTGSTLVLINGRRAIGAAYFGGNLQADVNAIPLAAIERIEVLSSSASAIYGGAAMGGVVNVVLKQNYSGGDLKLRYENTFDSDAPIREIDLAYGTSLEGGRTNFLVAGHYSDTDWLVNADRPELMERGFQRVLAGSPTLLYSGTNPFHVGTTPNISSVNGSNLTLDGGISLGSPFTHVPSGYTAGSDPAALLANAGSYNLTLPYTADYAKGLNRPLGSAPRIASVMAVARREMTDDLELFTEFFVGKNSAKALFNPLLSNYVVPASAPSNPFEQDVRVSIPDNTQNNPYETRITTRRAVLGFIYDLPGGWKAEGDYTWNGVDNEVSAHYAFIGDALASGALNPFVDTLASPLDLSPYVTGMDGTPYFSAKSYLHDVGLRFVGQPGNLPAGKPIVTIGLGFRKEGIQMGREVAFNSSSDPFRGFDFRYFPQSQKIYSLYGEGLIPLVSDRNSIPGVRKFDLQLAVRSERYATESGTGAASADSGTVPVYSTVNYTSTNSTIGLRYEIVKSVALRASYSSAFLPPTYSQLLPGGLVSINTVEVIDPRRGNQTALVHVRTGGNPDLEPTNTDNFNFGLTLEPSFVPGLRLSADFFRFDQRDVIVRPTVLQIVNSEAQFPERVVRDPVAPGDPYEAGPINLIDQRLLNGTRAELRGVDFGLDYARSTDSHGSFHFSSAATLFKSYRIQDAIDLPLVDRVNQVANNGPLKFKANAALGWDFRSWSAGWITYYFGSYDQYNVGSNLYVLAQGGEKVPSQVYHDFYVGYRFPDAQDAPRFGNLLSGVELQLGVKNVLDEAPQFDAFYSITAYYSPFGNPRMRSYSLSLSKSF